MKRARFFAVLMIAVLVCMSLAPTGSRASEDLLRIRSWRFLPLEEKPKRLCFNADYGGGFKFSLKRMKVDGEKRRGIKMKSTQDDGYGFVNTGNRLGDNWSLKATYTFHKDKGMKCGSTFAGLEVDYPYVPMGTIPAKFIFVGVTWNSWGLSTFVNDSGSTTGSQATYPDSESVDVEIVHETDVEYSIKTRATGTTLWDTLYVGDPSMVMETPGGVGFGASNLGDGGSVFLCGLEAEGEIFTGLKKNYLEDLQQAIDFETAALGYAEFHEKHSALTDAMLLIEVLMADIQEDYVLGDIDIDYDAVMKALKKAHKNDGKAAKKVDSSVQVIMRWGDKERKRVEKAIAKKRKAMDLIQKMEVFD